LIISGDEEEEEELSVSQNEVKVSSYMPDQAQKVERRSSEVGSALKRQ